MSFGARQKRVARHRRAVQGIERRLAMWAGEDPRGNDLLALPELAYLKNKSRDELLVLQQAAQVGFKRYEEEGCVLPRQCLPNVASNPAGSNLPRAIILPTTDS